MEEPMAEDIFQIKIDLASSGKRFIRCAYRGPDGNVYYSGARELAGEDVSVLASVVMAKAQGHFEAASEARRYVKVIVPEAQVNE
jgi:hypothetical protein